MRPVMFFPPDGPLWWKSFFQPHLNQTSSMFVLRNGDTTQVYNTLGRCKTTPETNAKDFISQHQDYIDALAADLAYASFTRAVCTKKVRAFQIRDGFGFLFKEHLRYRDLNLEDPRPDGHEKILPIFSTQPLPTSAHERLNFVARVTQDINLYCPAHAVDLVVQDLDFIPF